MSDWTYCEDGTPKKEGEYITTCYEKGRVVAYVTTLYYGRVGNRLAWSEEIDPGDWEENKDVIAWMPVPRPYKHDEPGWTLFSDSEPTEEGRYFLTCFKKTTGKFMVEAEYLNMYNYKRNAYEKKFDIFAGWHLKEMPELIAWMPFPDPCPLKKDMEEIGAFERFIREAIDDARFKHEQKEFFQKVIIDRDGRVHIKALTIPNDLEIVVKKAEEE